MAKRIESHSAEDPDWSGDPGVRSIANLYNEAFCVDKEWSFKKARAFEWWAHDLRQVLWADVGFRDQGIDIFRLCARTDFLDDVKISGKQLNDALNEINGKRSIKPCRKGSPPNPRRSEWPESVIAAPTAFCLCRIARCS